VPAPAIKGYPMLEVPVIDLTPYRKGCDPQSVARAVDRACRDIGFLVVWPRRPRRSHRRDGAALDRVLRPAASGENEGGAACLGRAILEENLARSRGAQAPADLNESFLIGMPDPPDTAYHRGPAAGQHFAPNLWPERPARLRAVWTD
jgi:hypothetical protein